VESNSEVTALHKGSNQQLYVEIEWILWILLCFALLPRIIFAVIFFLQTLRLERRHPIKVTTQGLTYCPHPAQAPGMGCPEKPPFLGISIKERERVLRFLSPKLLNCRGNCW